MAFFFLFDNEWLDDSNVQPPDHGVPIDEQDPDHSPLVRADLEAGYLPDDIMLVRCPHCTKWSWYSGGFTSGCEWCGKWAVTPDSEDEVCTLDDWWMLGDYYAGA